MSLLDIARDTLKNLPVSDIVRERLSLALDRLSEAEAKIGEFQIQIGGLTSQLEVEQRNHAHAKQELQTLRDTWAEVIRIQKGIEFRRGKRTGDKWMAFCPKCHLPVSHRDGRIDVLCSDMACKWHIRLDNMDVSQIIKELGA